MTRAALRAHVGNVLLVGKFDLRPLRDRITPRGLPVLRTRRACQQQKRCSKGILQFLQS